VYVGSQDGKLYAISATTGTVAWKAALAGPANGSPAFDQKNSTLVIGDTAGAVVWLAQAGSTLTGSPAIMDNAVFVGRANNGLCCFTPFGEPVV